MRNYDVKRRHGVHWPPGTRSVGQHDVLGTHHVYAAYSLLSPEALEFLGAKRMTGLDLNALMAFIVHKIWVTETGFLIKVECKPRSGARGDYLAIPVNGKSRDEVTHGIMALLHEPQEEMLHEHSSLAR